MCLRQSLGSLDSRGCHHFPWEPNKSYATKISCWHKDLFFLFSQTQGRRLLSREVERKKTPKSKFALKFKQSIMPWEETQLTGGYKYKYNWSPGGAYRHQTRLARHGRPPWRLSTPLQPPRPPPGLAVAAGSPCFLPQCPAITKTFSIPLPVPGGSAWIKSLHLLH